ncbi:hypothetical protein ISCGN_000713 [Ixodes scapularis]
MEKALWQFDDGAIECPVANSEREDLVAENIPRESLVFSAQLLQRGGPETRVQTRREKKEREKHERTFHRSGQVCFGASPQWGARYMPFVCRSTFSLSAAASHGDLPGFVSIEEAMLQINVFFFFFFVM